MLTLLAAATLSCVAVDGDSLRCDDERIRLLGIDAPEFSCPRNRRCVPGDPQAAKDYLARLIAGRSVEIVRHGEDRYGRTLAVVYAGGMNLSCAMIQAGHAAYIQRWDNGGAIARDC
ncbi:thermonuclease family protein [Erythrobacter sp.]|uniref:thermonuclease family protein n=1 Tax=Erythrobacter sp. TaxID=1042 RepID=UPI001425CA3E|nr:thermonuclease family protein [Erythrobacter sp.]QIQ87958.1 MAG: thermonuclease family protein [Erythrobacter sp.]